MLNSIFPPYPLSIIEKTQAFFNSSLSKKNGIFALFAIKNAIPIQEIYGTDCINRVTENLAQALRNAWMDKAFCLFISKGLLLIFWNNANKEDVSYLIDKVMDVTRSYALEEKEILYIVPCMGMVHVESLSQFTVEDLLQKATLALYYVHYSSNATYGFYHLIEEQHKHVSKEMCMAHYYQEAVKCKKLRLAFQPIVSSKKGNTVYHECLLRIVAADGTLQSAGPYVAIAEKMGFVDQLDHQVLDMVVQELELDPFISLSFNVSNMTVSNPTWIIHAERLLSDPSIASRVIIEVTETAVNLNLREVAYFTAFFQGLGCQVALDDFGAGYTSFKQLKALSVDIIKIDGSFIKDITSNPDSRLFVKTLLHFATNLGLKAVAEFVENGEIAKMLMDLKIEYMQGNYFSPAVTTRSWIQEPGDNDAIITP